MAHIVEVSVTGLAGRSGIYHQTLNRYVNVFFGQNGSGKTSLLKILNSAMNTDSELLINVPFKSAEVKIYSVNYDITFTYTLKKKLTPRTKLSITEASEIDDLVTSEPIIIMEADLRKSSRPAKSFPNWTVEPALPGGRKKIKWNHTYLPTSRLYMGDYELFTRNYRDVISEDELDKAFSRNLHKMWSDYQGNTIRAINKTQQDGLAGILTSVITGKSRTKKRQKQIDIRTAYDRITNFLTRQGSPKIIGSFSKFQADYDKNQQLQNLIWEIDETEKIIAELMAPRNQLESLIQGMFSGNKTIKFGDDSIDVTTIENESIGVSALSSGEKQSLMLLIQALRVEESSLLIDEPEISMHIDWQKELVSTMRVLNPSAQLILATHSPDIMSNVHDEMIFRL